MQEDSARADFSALFLILSGLGLTGLAPDALRVSEGPVVAVLSVVTVVAILWFVRLLRHPVGKRNPPTA